MDSHFQTKNYFILFTVNNLCDLEVPLECANVLPAFAMVTFDQILN